MKKLILFLICLLITETCFAEKAAVLREIVVLQNSNGQPVATAQASDSSGRFELVFTANKKVGDKLPLYRYTAKIPSSEIPQVCRVSF